MTRIFNFVILFFLVGVFYIQTDGFGAGTMTANVERAKQARFVADDAPIVLASMSAKGVKDTPQEPIKVANINAMSEAEKEAVKQRFIAMRLASSTVIRTVKMTKSTLQSASAPRENRMVVAGTVVNARSEPTTSSAVLAKLRRGTEVLPTGQSNGEWAQVIVSTSGQAVWMHSDFLKTQS